MLILAIESSCDETSCAIIKDGFEVLSNSVSTQIEIHKQYGGVFPEVASRLHVENINIVIKDALDKANIKIEDVDAIAVTQGPGLIGSLHVGVMAAKTLAWSLGKPLIPVHHIAGHIYANKLVGDLKFPLLALVISGGHTELVSMQDEYQFEVIGKTQDDAVGEAFDKVARLLGLGYPGGPVIDKLAQTGKENYQLPKVKTENPLDFSFSGLKSAVRQLTLREERNDREIIVEDVAYAFQHAAVRELMSRVEYALENSEVQYESLVLAGGVAANSEVRKQIVALNAQYPSLNILVPPLWACMDQAAMIGLAGQIAYDKGVRGDCEISALSNKQLISY
ncbi:tRNA (adenosine(37)-N6)-threonylcarbamoyltransferase complex transferase subunit TsaD [Erysipelothrix rhusiopathiae]|uniref:tRNA N6-adenosine threonylcarbamoyltransferase n=1 Tax=Erysipelothrix rhusiopathiae ATCC 19414 TaxID=525280 RepID=E7FVB6_ERYRH|nr:tRNA (adenosine(37)-N6)-threonylcarbamoyltransferase complex transferase subunit TsaD [Erysipelothrix rhusiopathiae]AGN24275.1 UGMP family protein [Erysipelothrix rhusiopathiae SY1027]AMS10962.1 N(6)-L-threonylcarbamoyladenine synthase TsaD [Erysipelothrix rhusiopathiae]AOO67460.1 tRNA (adenosine(37)-N6)-threonylcarbamoyltransferase complex transferase subunit TsaD [Erysipelothrix rhusiopathiae]EFY09797.1 putative glycoprotease GCP [Erysipelothrix rhusiopathiae ATCC 19414]MDE8256795.1 tRNA 